jgi:hypothetical protein
MGLVMTWIASCSGQRGIYQETIMTDEERQKLCEALRGKRPWPGALAKMMPDAADEIERLAAEHKHDVSMLETAADLLERLAHELVATDERLKQLEARIEALERM